GKENIISEENISEENFYSEGLIKIWSEPVAGYGFSYKKYKYKYYTYKDDSMEEYEEEIVGEATSTKITFVDSKTGYIYEKDLFAPTTTPRQITSSSFPNIAKAYFMNDDKNETSRVVLQYVSEREIVKTITANIPDYFGIPSRLINITEMPDNITNISISPDFKKAFYIVKKGGGGNDYYTDWYLINKDTDTYGKRVFTSNLTYWKGAVTDTKDIFVYQASTAFEKSTLYKLGSDSSLSQIYEGHTGNGFLINNSSTLNSMFTNSGLRTFLNMSFNKGNYSDKDLLGLGFNTLAEKCALSSTLTICGVPREIKNYDSGLPDGWYQGFTTWRDDLYVVNEEYPSGALLFDFKADGEVYDVIDSKELKINDLLTHLIFINNNDGSLWSLNINNILLPEEVLGD
ncbi:MAG: hypothetical protein RI945_362, partial [Candidatus Parcubacteria bacterium]